MPLLGGIAWTAAAKTSTQLLTWIATLTVARLLSPYDFGILGMATVYLGLIALLSEFSLGAAVVTLREMTDNQIAQLNTISVVFGATAVALSSAAAAPLGWFFKSAELPWVVVAMSAAYLITAFKTVPNALLQRDLRFKRLAVVEACQALSQSVCAVLLALLGLRYWALVVAGLLGNSVSAGLLMAMRPHAFARPRLESIKDALSFSRDAAVTSLSWYGYSNADFIVAGRVLGQAGLGTYTVAWNLAVAPNERISSLVTRVTPAFLSAARSDRSALWRYLRSLTEGISLLAFPAAIGLALVSKDFILVVLGKKWEGAILPLELLALCMALQSVTPLLPQVLFVVGESRFMMKYALMALFVMPSAFLVGSSWGTVGIAGAWLIGYPILAQGLLRHTLRSIGIPVKQYLKVVWPAFSGSLVMAMAVVPIRCFMATNWPLYLRLVVEVLVGASAYLLAILVFHRDRAATFLEFVRTLRQ